MSAEWEHDLSVWPEGVARHVLAEVDSTNSEAARLAPGLTKATWILAHRQSAARGRRGRAWASPEGNLSSTLLMPFVGAPADAALRSFVAALALADALGAVCGPGANIALKWPNDVLLNGGKVAGILLESTGQGGSTHHLVVGIGVNLAAAPPAETVEPGAVLPVSVLGETGVVVAPEAFLPYLANAFAHWETQLSTHGFSEVRAAWLVRAAKLGQPLTARTGSEVIEGIFETIAEDGMLVLTTPNGPRKIPAADVFF
ncbi:MAG: biotin--[acetyl-CoA-carboxylase] ligase [Albidovulum sp.]